LVGVVGVVGVVVSGKDMEWEEVEVTLLGVEMSSGISSSFWVEVCGVVMV